MPLPHVLPRQAERAPGHAVRTGFQSLSQGAFSLSETFPQQSDGKNSVAAGRSQCLRAKPRRAAIVRAHGRHTRAAVTRPTPALGAP